MKSKVISLLTLLPVLSISAIAFAQTTDTEEITLSTYYPAPYGEYDELFSERLLVWRPDAAEMIDMGEGDCHIGWSMVVGAGGTGFSYDELDAAGTLPGDGVVLIKESLGIGTTSPVAKLTVAGETWITSSASTPIFIYHPTADTNTQDIEFLHAAAGSAAIRSFRGGSWDTYLQFLTTVDATGKQVRMTIDHSGNVGIGTTTPASLLHVDTQSSATGLQNVLRLETEQGSINDELGILFKFISNIDAAAIRTRITNAGDKTLSFFTSSEDTTDGSSLTEKMTITHDGNVGIGTTSPSFPLHMASGAYVTTGGVWTDASSMEYKRDIVPLTFDKALETLVGLNPVTFRSKVAPEEEHVGFIAEEVPELVATKDRKGLSPMDIVAVLTKVVQRQQEEINTLTAQLDITNKGRPKEGASEHENR